MWIPLYQVFMFINDHPLQKDQNEVESLVGLPLATEYTYLVSLMIIEQ